jgi:hypothetical protein
VARVGRPVARIAITVVALALVLTGCGSDEKPDAQGARRTTTTQATTQQSHPVIAAAGDIACPSACDTTKKVADLLVADDYTAVLTLGDNQYEDGRLSDFEAIYDTTWGRVKDKTYPAPGNHDYHTEDAAGYFDYFGARAGPRGRGYYSFDVGAWHLISLNSEANFDEQVDWVEADLAASRARCTLAFWHKPIWTSGNVHRDDGEPMQPVWRALVAGGADVVLNGHVHNYERFAPRSGIREFIVGTGGRGTHYGFGETAPGSEVRDNSTDGILALTLHADGYDWRFLPVAGASFTDRGSDRCR